MIYAFDKAQGPIPSPFTVWRLYRGDSLHCFDITGDNRCWANPDKRSYPKSQKSSSHCDQRYFRVIHHTALSTSKSRYADCRPGVFSRNPATSKIGKVDRGHGSNDNRIAHSKRTERKEVPVQSAKQLELQIVAERREARSALQPSCLLGWP